MSDVRAGLEKVMRATLADQAAHGTWTYAAVRPEPVPASWKPGQKVRADCSKGVQFLCRWTPGCPDPMGNHWADWGNSTTICMNLQHLAVPSELFVGDLVTFGPDGDDHAAMVLERGTDPLLWSDGHQGAPNTYRLSQDRRVHQLLRLPVPTYVPTPEDKLRARTGWFAWAAWWLGEGDWKHYGRENPKVRPDVPVDVPHDYWERMGKFLAGRRKPNRPTTRP